MSGPLEEIAGLFDTVYVSFYKDLGGIAGSGLAGPEDFIAEAREWRLRHGGTIVRHVALCRLGIGRHRDPSAPDEGLSGACAGDRRCPA